jgi:hypothetical protein
VIEHGGGDYPYATFLALVPALKLGVFLATNTGVNTRAVAKMAYQMLDLFVRQVRNPLVSSNDPLGRNHTKV